MKHYNLAKCVFWVLLLLAGCDKDVNVQNPTLRDRVISCSAGFGENLGMSLKGSYERHKGTKLSPGFKAESKSIIFSVLPEQDRLRAYEDYIKCIETPLDNAPTTP